MAKLCDVSPGLGGELPLKFLALLAPSHLCIPDDGLDEWHFLWALPGKIIFCVFRIDTIYPFQHAHFSQSSYSPCHLPAQLGVTFSGL